MLKLLFIVKKKKEKKSLFLIQSLLALFNHEYFAIQKKRGGGNSSSTSTLSTTTFGQSCSRGDLSISREKMELRSADGKMRVPCKAARLFELSSWGPTRRNKLTDVVLDAAIKTSRFNAVSYTCSFM